MYAYSTIASHRICICITKLDLLFLFYLFFHTFFHALDIESQTYLKHNNVRCPLALIVYHNCYPILRPVLVIYFYTLGRSEERRVFNWQW